MQETGWVPVRAIEQRIRTEARRGFQKHVIRFARAEHLQIWEKNQVRPEARWSGSVSIPGNGENNGINGSGYAS
jgi:hypothetical protein